MSRKSFIESLGATCDNWNWSWSFVNHKKKFVIFGAWDKLTDDEKAVILDEDWEFQNGRKKAGYHQSREHIRLIEEKDYLLKIFKMIYLEEKLDKNQIGPATIGDFIPEVFPKVLMKIDKKWYAVNDPTLNILPEEIYNPEQFFEGTSTTISVNVYERNPQARARCIQHYGLKCFLCQFDFEQIYGELGKGYIHVHHITPLYRIGELYKIDPINDLRPVCPNCHAIIHRYGETRTIEEMILLLNPHKN